MKCASLFCLLATPFTGLAQSRASVSDFLESYDRAVVANDSDWTLAHTDPTAIFRTPSIVTYRQIAARARWARSNPSPSSVEECRTTADTVEIKGERAIVDFTTTIRYKYGVAPKER